MEISPATAVFFEVPENWKMVKISSFVDVNVLYLFPSFFEKEGFATRCASSRASLMEGLR